MSQLPNSTRRLFLQVASLQVGAIALGGCGGASDGPIDATGASAPNPAPPPSQPPSPSPPGSQPAWLSGLGLLTWKRLTGSSIANVGAQQGLGAWSGGVYDPVRHQIVINGGGHSDSWDNGVYAIRMGLDRPAPVVLKASSGSATLDADYNADGTPTSRHTYGNLTYVPALDRVFQLGGGAIQGTGNFNSVKVNGFRLSDNQWDPAGTWPSRAAPNNPGETTCIDGAGKVYVACNQQANIQTWLPGAGNPWATLPSSGISGAPIYTPLVYDSVRDRIVFFNGAGSAWWTTAGVRTNFAPSGTSASRAAPFNFWVHVADYPGGDRLIGVDSNTADIYQGNPSTYSFSPLAISGTGLAGGAGGFGMYFGRFGVIQEYGVIYLITDVASDCYLFRYR